MLNCSAIITSHPPPTVPRRNHGRRRCLSASPQPVARTTVFSTNPRISVVMYSVIALNKLLGHSLWVLHLVECLPAKSMVDWLLLKVTEDRRSRTPGPMMTSRQPVAPEVTLSDMTQRQHKLSQSNSSSTSGLTFTARTNSYLGTANNGSSALIGSQTNGFDQSGTNLSLLIVKRDLLIHANCQEIHLLKIHLINLGVY